MVIDDKIKKYEPFFGKWKISRELGKGSFGRVFEIYWEDGLGGHSTSALKVIHIPSEDALKQQMEVQPNMEAVRNYFLKQVERIKDEIRILQSCKGQSNIVSYEDHMIVEDVRENKIGWDILIRMELLYPISPVTQYDVVKMWRDIAQALIYCEEQNIIHRDIKPANILISTGGDYKLSDFGVARKCMQDTDASTRVGTERYMAPEVYNSKKYDKKYDKRADYYSLGCVIYYFLNKSRHVFFPPYPQELEAKDIDYAEAKRISGEKIPKIKGVSQEINDVLLKSMAYRPSNRYRSAKELCRAIQRILDKQGDALRQRKLKEDESEVFSGGSEPPMNSKPSRYVKASGTPKSSERSRSFTPSGTSGNSKPSLSIVVAGVFLVAGVGGIIYGLYVKNNQRLTIFMDSMINENGMIEITSSYVTLRGKSRPGCRLILSINDREDIIDSDGNWEYMLPVVDLEDQAYNNISVSYEDSSGKSEVLEFYVDLESEVPPYDITEEVMSEKGERITEILVSKETEQETIFVISEESETVIETETNRETETETGTGTERKSEAGTATGTERESKTETVIGTERESKTETETGTERESKTETVIGTEKESRAEKESKMETVTGTEKESRTERESRTETETGTERESKTETVIGTERETVTESMTVIETESETEAPVPTLRVLGKFERPGDGDKFDQNIKIKGWVLVNEEMGDVDIYADMVADGSVVESFLLDRTALGENTFQTRKRKYASEIAAVSGYEVRGSQSLENIPDGSYELNLCVVDQKSAEKEILETVKIYVSGESLKSTGDVLDFMGLKEEIQEQDTHYIYEEKGFAIGMDVEGEDSVITANADQVILTGWINADEGTSLGLILEIDSELYTADKLAELGGELIISRVPRNLEKMDTALTGTSVLDTDAAGCIISMKLPFLSEGTHTLAISFNVGVPGRETEIVDISPVIINIDPLSNVQEEAVERIAESWGNEFPKQTEAQTGEDMGQEQETGE